MSKRLNVDSIARMYSDEEADLSDRNAVLDEARCASCGSLLPERGDELFLTCTSCGRVVGDVEDQSESHG